MFYKLPPAGNHITKEVSSTSLEDIKELFNPYMINFYGSGAQSLAAAINSIKLQKCIKQPEIIIPAYSCPELVSAIIFNAITPVLVDLEYQKPWISLTELSQKITDKTIGIIAVNLFGIPERLDQLKAICEYNNIFLIEDSAQAFPELSDNRFWYGDFVVLSFGRGKPVSALGGGAVLTLNQDLYKSLPACGREFPNRDFLNKMLYQFKILIYNALINPHLYSLVSALPFLHLGETYYHELYDIHSMHKDNLNILSSNINLYIDRQEDFMNLNQSLDSIVLHSNLCNLTKSCYPEDTSLRLNRYPLIAQSRQHRDDLFANLEKSGLGVSKMYKKPLNEIDGIDKVLDDQRCFKNAKFFSDTLLTLPTHKGVTKQNIGQINEAIDLSR